MSFVDVQHSDRVVFNVASRNRVEKIDRTTWTAFTRFVLLLLLRFRLFLFLRLGFAGSGAAAVTGSFACTSSLPPDSRKSTRGTCLRCRDNTAFDQIKQFSNFVSLDDRLGFALCAQ